MLAYEKTEVEELLRPLHPPLSPISCPPITQKALSRCMAKLGSHIVQGDISRIENQKIGITDLQLIAIAKCLDVSAAKLIGAK